MLAGSIPEHSASMNANNNNFAREEVEAMKHSIVYEYQNINNIQEEASTVNQFQSSNRLGRTKHIYIA